MTLVCASAVEADLPETTSERSADAYNADSVDSKSDLEILDSFIEHLELLEIKEGKERELKDILMDIKKELIEGTETGAVTDKNDKNTAVTEKDSVSTDDSSDQVYDSVKIGGSAAIKVIGILLDIILVAIIVVLLIIVLNKKGFDFLRGLIPRKKKKYRAGDPIITEQHKIGGTYGVPPAVQSNSVQSNRIPEPSIENKRDPGRIAAAFEAEQESSVPKSNIHDAKPAVSKQQDKQQLACDSILRCYNGENVDVSEWEWYELDRSSAIGNDDYIRKMDDGYSVLNFTPVKGSKLFHEYVLLNKKYLFPNFYSKSPLIMYDRNEKFIRKFNETYMSYTFNCYNRNGNRFDYSNFNRPGDVRILKIVPATVKVDEETGVAKIVRPGEIYFN